MRLYYKTLMACYQPKAVLYIISMLLCHRLMSCSMYLFIISVVFYYFYYSVVSLYYNMLTNGRN